MLKAHLGLGWRAKVILANESGRITRLSQCLGQTAKLSHRRPIGNIKDRWQAIVHPVL